MLTDPITTIPEWRITNPRVEYLVEPFAVGIDVATPRFGWVVDVADDAAGNRGQTWLLCTPKPNPTRLNPTQSQPTAAVRGARQEGFQLVVKGADSGAVVWDSGKVESEESRHVPFGSVGQKVRFEMK